MAQTGKKSTSAKKTAKPAASRQTPAKPSQAKAAPDTDELAVPKRPIRREIGAVICLLLAVFLLFVCFFDGGPALTVPKEWLVWLIGAGSYVLPFALFADAVFLCFHRGRPVAFRVTCALLFPVTVGFLRNDVGLTGKASAKLSELTHPAFIKLIFALVCALLLVFVFGKPVARIISSYRTRQRREYIPAPEPEPRVIPPRTVTDKRRRRRAIDIPLDGDAPPVTAEPYTAYTGEDSTEKPAPVKPADTAEAADDNGDIELDIPFMETGKSITQQREDAKAAQKRDKKDVKSAPEKEIAAHTPEIAPQGDDYSYPPTELLSSGGIARVDGAEEVRLNSERLVAAFKSFGVTVRISATTRGPSVTRYEAELEAGVKLSRLTGLADDIALSLGAVGVRISAMPDKISTVGVEVPNKLVSTVFLRDIIESREFKTAQSKLTFAIGKNISGEAIVGNISKLPHMLVAGTTGSGKSVCLNSLILSILYKATPDDVRFIMIDPKMVEFRVYNGIPHLLVPVVTDVKKASGALQWAVVEMMKRYRLFSETNARDLESYNKLMVKAGERTVPQIIVVIDELADLMMTAAKEVEDSVCRVAQMGRAAGVHLIIATQSPRADVITGLMKANIPSRIALKVSSALESRIILDAGGNADKLVGNGDMLYAPIGGGKPMRVQGAWVTDNERESVVEYIKTRGETQYSDDVISEIERAAAEKTSGAAGDSRADDNDYDELMPQAAEVIFETNQASVSMLQRRLKLGYARAARIVDQLEQIGVVGPFEGSKPRQILIKREQWQEMQYGAGTAPVDTFVARQDDAVEDEDDEDAPF
jgi:S-DNA-T family DNA segregation ATPase FtsK/SpoIIIE